jgi:hypothetical protein
MATGRKDPVEVRRENDKGGSMRAGTKEFLAGCVFVSALLMILWICFAAVPEGFYR